jgi:hypothetical protein
MRPQADVMEIDIAAVIASLEAEQTLALSGRQVAASRKASRRRRVTDFARWLFRRN